MAVVFLLQGCSGSPLAVYDLYKADSLFDRIEGIMRREKKMSFDQRVPYYRQACSLYGKAFFRDRRVFKLDDIENAAHACDAGGLEDERDKYLAFEEEYIREHPKEAEYGPNPFGGPMDYT